MVVIVRWLLQAGKYSCVSGCMVDSFVCFMLYLDKISGERLQDHWSSGLIFATNIRVNPITKIQNFLLSKIWCFYQKN